MIEFETKNIKCKENQVFDSLRGWVHEKHLIAISMYISNLKEKTLKGANYSQHYMQIKEALQQGNI